MPLYLGNTLISDVAVKGAVNLDSELAQQDTLIDQIYDALDNISAGNGNAGGGGSNADLSAVTATAADVLAGKVIVGSDGNPITGTIPSVDGATITPGVSSKTAVRAGSYTTGKIIVKGDSNLKAANIKSGTSIFGVTGTYTGSTSSTKCYQGSVLVGSTNPTSFTISSLNLSSIDYIYICFSANFAQGYDDNCFVCCYGSGSSLSGHVWRSGQKTMSSVSATVSFSGSTLTITSSNSSYRFPGTANYLIVGA